MPRVNPQPVPSRVSVRSAEGTSSAESAGQRAGPSSHIQTVRCHRSHAFRNTWPRSSGIFEGAVSTETALSPASTRPGRALLSNCCTVDRHRPDCPLRLNRLEFSEQGDRSSMTVGFRNRHKPEPWSFSTALSRHMIEDAGLARTRVLRFALHMLLQAAPDKPNFKDKRSDAWCSDLDARVDRIFFGFLWQATELEQFDRTGWQRRVLDEAREVLDAAIRSAPVPSARRYRAIAGALNSFYAARKKHFPNVQQPQSVGAAHES